MGKQESGLMITYTRAYLSSGFRDILFPVPVAILLRILPEAGFVLPGELRITTPLRVRLMVRGDDIAKKGDFSLALNSERGFIGLGGPTPELVADEFVQLKSLIRDRLALDVDTKATFHEFIAAGSIRGKRNPLETFAALSQQLRPLSKFEELLHGHVALFGVRMSPAGQDPNQPDWTEITLEPLVERATEFYSFEVIFRRKSAEPVLAFAQGFSETIRQLTNYVEQE